MSTALDNLPARANGLAIRPMSDFVDVVQHLSELWDLASILHKSRMIPSTIATPEAAVAIILKGRELGIGPMHAFDSISVIQGKPTISPQLMLALIERSGSLEDMAVEEHPQSCTITLKRRGRSPQRVTFDKEEANSMGLWGKGNWLKMPGVMLYWRCVAKACRRVFPDIIAGCYTPDEMGASVGEDGEIIDGEVMAPALPEPAPAPRHPQGKNSLHPNESGFHNGQYASQDDADRYVARLKGKLYGTEKEPGGLNGQWADFWQDPKTGEFPPVKACENELMSVHQADRHLVKWLVETGQIDRDALDTLGQPRLLGRHVAIVLNRSEAEARAVRAELDAYMVRTFNDTKEAIYRKHPDLAPEGFAEEQAEAAAVTTPADRGDAYEGGA